MHVAFPFGEMVECIEHVVNHFGIAFWRAFVFFNEFCFNIIDVQFKVEHALEPVSENGVIGVGRTNGIGSARARKAHAAKVVMISR